MKRHILALCASLCFSSAPSSIWAQLNPDSLSVRIDRLLAATPLVDGHNDLLVHYMDCAECPRDFDAYDLSKRTEGATDIPRWRAGRVGVQLLNVFGPEYTTRSTLEGFDLILRLPERYPDDLAIAATADDVRRIHRSGRIAIIPTLEYAIRLENSLSVLRMFHRLGLRAVTLAYDTNDLADGSDDTRRHGGLSTLGAEMVREMNRLGMLVDISHVSTAVMHDVLDIAEAPVIFTHSSARALTDVNRNVPDDVLKRLPANGGVVMVSFVPYFSTQANAEWAALGDSLWTLAMDRYDGNEAEVEREMDEASAKFPMPTVTVADVADHVEHVQAMAGIDHVGIGSDFDGLDYAIQGMEDVSSFPMLFEELARRGWTDDALKKLAGENFLRILTDAEEVAIRRATDTR